MHSQANIIVSAALIMLLQVFPARADEIVMRNGERFSSSEIWEENGRIRFNMQGIVVSVDKEEVAAVIVDNHASTDRSSASAAAAPIEAVPNIPAAAAPESWRLPIVPSRQARSKTPVGIGLEGVYWRMPTEALPGIEKVETDPAFGGIDQYRRPGQAMTLGDAPLDGWVFGFWRNQLYSIMWWANGRSGYERMKKEVFSRYGGGIRSKTHAERFIWDQEGTQRMLEFDAKRDTGLFIMRSSELNKRIKELYP